MRSNSWIARYLHSTLHSAFYDAVSVSNVRYQKYVCFLFLVLISCDERPI